MNPREIEEYKALRSTIRERGSLRVWLFFAVLTAWAALTLATAALAALPIATLLPLPIATLLPLLLLASGFEAVWQLHTGVERVGRYLQVFYAEDDGAPAPREWERTVMAYGRSRWRGSDPLFTSYFIGAAVLNFVPVMLAAPVALELAVIGAVHLVFIARVFVARHASSKQRGRDLEQFEQIKRAGRAEEAG